MRVVFGLSTKNAREVSDVTERQPGRKRLAGIAGLALAGLIVLTPAGGTLAQQLDRAGSPARGHAQVVAQSVIDFEGSVRWEVSRESAGDQPSNDTAAGPGFLVGADGVVLLTDSSTGLVQRLAAGEATEIIESGVYERVAIGEGDALVYELGLVGSGEGSDDPLFRGGTNDDLGGMRDVDLVRDSLRPKEKATVPAGEAPTLVLVTDGEVRVKVAGSNGSTRLTEGEAAEFSGELQILAGQDDPASFVAAIVGPDLIERSTGDSTPTAGGNGSSRPAQYSDSDGDGLDDGLEARIGTDPMNPDSDQDGLSDGDEVLVYGTNPLSMDSDGDMLPDYNEVMQHGTNPADPDSDDDLINDHDELNYGTFPLVPDSDGDGLFDGVELFTYASDPLDADTDDDGLSDGDEVNLYGSLPTLTDTDGDLLPDYNEVMQHGTNPAVADTDGDGISDHDELGYGTSPIDADSDDDGALDGAEIIAGTNPLDPNSKP